MLIRVLALLLILPSLLGFQVLAQDNDRHTIATLHYGNSSSNVLARKGMLDVLQAYGFIDSEERELLDTEQDVQGERINMFWRDAGYDLTTANIMVEEALDRGATVLATVSTAVTKIAVGLTSDMDDPVPVLFSIVTAPYVPGIADAPCIKPDHVTGTQAFIAYDQMVSLVQLLNADIETIGTTINAGEPNSVYGSDQIVSHASALGFQVERVPITQASDLPLALESLIDRGAQAIVVPGGSAESRVIASVAGVALEAGVPVVAPSPSHAMRGAPIGAGFNEFYREGTIVGRMLAAFLRNDTTLSNLKINAIPTLTVALNHDTADEYGLQFSDELIDAADIHIRNGETDIDASPTELPELTNEERRAADLEFLASLECTPEMIAEQQAELDAASN